MDTSSLITRLLRGLISAFVLIPIVSGTCRADSARIPAGFLNRIEGKVSICPFPCSGVFRELSPATAAGRILYAGDVFRCKPGKAFVYKSESGKAAEDFCASKENVLAPPAGYTPQTPVPGQRIPTLVTLQSYGRIGGRDKGSESPIYSPSPKGAVIASEFIIRWRTNPPLGRLSITLRAHDSSELIHADNIDGSSGVLDSGAFRKALAGYLDSAGPNPEARLVFKDEAGREQSVDFSLLSRAQEKALNDELSQLDPSHGLFRYVERAAVFESFRMYGNVAAEYELGLKEAPLSHDMMQAAFQANSRIGNLRRARDLRDTLQKIDQQETEQGNSQGDK